jgi:hypothetical protein
MTMCGGVGGGDGERGKSECKFKFKCKFKCGRSRGEGAPSAQEPVRDFFWKNAVDGWEGVAIVLARSGNRAGGEPEKKSRDCKKSIDEKPGIARLTSPLKTGSCESGMVLQASGTSS